MVIPDNIGKLIHDLANNIDADDITFVGSISDYFHFNKLGIIYDRMIGDVDVRIKDVNVISKIEDVVGINARLVNSTNEYNQYYIKLLNGVAVDIFLDKSIKYDDEYVTYSGIKISIESLKCRVFTLGRTISRDNLEKPTNRKIFKYLRKHLLYYINLNIK